MKTQEQEIAEHRERLKDRSDDQLRTVIHSKVPHSAEHIAAQQLIDTRKTEKEEARHNEIQKKLEELKKPHWSTTYNFAATVIAAVASCLAVGLTAYQIRASKPAPEVPKSGPRLPAVQSRFSSSDKPSLNKQLQLSTTRKRKP